MKYERISKRSDEERGWERGVIGFELGAKKNNLVKRLSFRGKHLRESLPRELCLLSGIRGQNPGNGLRFLGCFRTKGGGGA